jgi:hypothetical protein
MKQYKLTLYFDNLDNYMGTDDQARAQFTVEADSYSHAVLLAVKFVRIFEADRYDLE